MRERAESERLKREKLQGVLEMAGVVCHELNQPVMAITGYTDIIGMKISEDDPLYDKIGKLKEQAMRVGKITQKLMKIAKYRPKHHAQGEKIVATEKATEREKDR
jgi:two-component system, response regulator PdtaR